MTRQEVYKRIDSERDYQSKVWNETTSTSKGEHSIEDFIVYMEDYLCEAKHVLSRTPQPECNKKASAIMRKVTAMGVSCMEQHGTEYRL